MSKPPIKWGLRISYAILGLALAAGLIGFGRGFAWTHVIVKPSTCLGMKKFAHCLEEQVEAQGASSPVAKCSPSAKVAVCDLQVAGAYGASCFAVTAETAKEGFPLITSVAEKECPH